jgi:hypothetical protein
MIETRKDSAVHVSLSSSSLVKQPGTEAPLPTYKGAFPATHSTANGNRIYRLFLHSSKMRSLKGATTRLGQGPKQRRAQWPGYRPARSWLSTAIVNKSSHGFDFFCGAKKL